MDRSEIYNQPEDRGYKWKTSDADFAMNDAERRRFLDIQGEFARKNKRQMDNETAVIRAKMDVGTLTREQARKLAWNLRQDRDVALAMDIAHEDRHNIDVVNEANGTKRRATWKDYYVPTSELDVKAGARDRSLFRRQKLSSANRYDSSSPQLKPKPGESRESWDRRLFAASLPGAFDSVDEQERRKGLFVARRYGFTAEVDPQLGRVFHRQTVDADADLDVYPHTGIMLPGTKAYADREARGMRAADRTIAAERDRFALTAPGVEWKDAFSRPSLARLAKVEKARANMKYGVDPYSGEVLRRTRGGKGTRLRTYIDDNYTGTLFRPHYRFADPEAAR